MRVFFSGPVCLSFFIRSLHASLTNDDEKDPMDVFARLDEWFPRRSVEEGTDTLPDAEDYTSPVLSKVKKTVFAASEMTLPVASDSQRWRKLYHALLSLSYTEEKAWREYLCTPEGAEDVRSRVNRLSRLQPYPDETIYFYVRELRELLPPKLARILYGEHGLIRKEEIRIALNNLNAQECMEIVKFANFNLSPVGNLEHEMTGAERALAWTTRYARGIQPFHEGYVDKLVENMAKWEIEQLVPEKDMRLLCRFHKLGDASSFYDFRSSSSESIPIRVAQELREKLRKKDRRIMQYTETQRIAN